MANAYDILKQVGIVNNLINLFSSSDINSVSSTSTDALRTIESDVSRQNRFTVQINLPQSLGLNISANTVNFYIQDASLPSQQLTLSEVNYQGKEIYAYLFKTTDSIILKFYDTKDQILRNMFLDWQTSIVPNNQIGLLPFYPSQYLSTMSITVHDKQYTLEGASPQSVGDFILSHGSQDSLGTFDVTMKVKKVS